MGSLCDLGLDGGLFFASSFSRFLLDNLVLGYVLIEDIVIEFKRILSSQIVVDLTTHWFNDTRFSRLSSVSESVVTLLHVLVKHLFIVYSSVFLLNKPLGR